MASSGKSASDALASRSSAEQPDNTTHLALSDLLCKASVKIGGTWVVDAYLPAEDKYDYTWQGKPRKGTNFVVTLVSAQKPSQYCQAHFRKTPKTSAKYEQTIKTIKHGVRFIMSNVRFVEDAKLAYISCPVKVVVDLSATKMDTCLGAPASAVQPVPTPTIAGSIDLAGNQFFDVTALIQEVQEIRQHANNRSSFIVKVYDGSLDNDTQKVKAMPLRIYFDTSGTGLNTAEQPVSELPRQSGEDIKKLAETHLQNKTAVSFFCISGAKDDEGKFCFRNTKHMFITKGVGAKAEHLNNHAELHNLPAAETVAFELQTTTAARDWSNEPGKETRCGLLSTFARTATGVPELDQGDTVWQCNWVRVSEPSEGQSIKNQFGSLWLPLTFRDDTGPVVLYITEKAVVKLTNVVDAAEFEQLHAEGRLRLPFFASIKIQRRPSNPSAAQPGIAQTNAAQPTRSDNDFDCFIVDAAEQDMNEIPSVRSTQLLPMLSHSADSVLPATLAMIRTSDHYAMAVQYITQELPPELSNVASKEKTGATILRPCSRAVALVLSSKRSKVVDAGACGHKLVTDGVVDYLSAGSAVAQDKYMLTSFCNLDNVTDFKLDPPKGAKVQAALVSVTGFLDAKTDSAEHPVQSLLVDDVQLLTPTQADALKPMLVKLLYFAALAGQVSRKRAREPWSPQENPAKTATCRTLGRSPTGPSLPDYSP